MTRIPIFFTFDNNFVNPAAVAFFSLLNRAKEGVWYEMYVLHHDITSANRKLLTEIVNRKGNAALTFIDTGDFLLDEWKRCNWEGNQEGARFTVDTVVRCFPARFFPQYDRIIYSDVDFVFRDDISELWDFQLDGAYMAGVRSPTLKSWPQYLSHFKPEHRAMLEDCYLAGGILIMDLKRFREDNLEERMLEIIRDDTIVKRWNDQDILNLACRGNVRFLSLRYYALPFLDEIMRTSGYAGVYSREELYDCVLRPKIIHFAAHKPWLERMNWDCEWWYIADYLKLDARRPPANGEALSAADAALRREKRVRRAWRLAFFIAMAGLVLALGVCIFKCGSGS